MELWERRVRWKVRGSRPPSCAGEAGDDSGGNLELEITKVKIERIMRRVKRECVVVVFEGREGVRGEGGGCLFDLSAPSLDALNREAPGLHRKC